MKELNKYADFVKEVTSEPSLDINVFISRLVELEKTGYNIPQLITGTDGICSEGGELKEIVKKILWQGKPLNEESAFHMKRELGDIMFYWAEVVMALGLDPYEVIDENVNKLQSRYPGGKFSIHHSENRVEGDL